MLHTTEKLTHSTSDVHRLFEIDHFGIPKDWVDMPNLVWLYEAVIKWAVSTCIHSLSAFYVFIRSHQLIIDIVMCQFDMREVY